MGFIGAQTYVEALFACSTDLPDLFIFKARLLIRSIVALNHKNSCNILLLFFNIDISLIFHVQLFRRGDTKKADSRELSPPLPSTSNILLQSRSSRPSTGQEWKLNLSAPYLRKVRSAFSSSDANGGVTPRSSVSTEGNSDWDIISRRSASVNSCVSQYPSSELVDDLSLLNFARPEGSRYGPECNAIPHSEVSLCNSSPHSVQVQTNTYTDNLSSNPFEN